MATSVVNPNKVLFTGQNPFLRLKASADSPDTTTCAFWRAHLSPAGPGHALFITSDVTDGKVLVLSDNTDFARWVQQIEAHLRPPFGDQSLPIEPARFTCSGDPRSSWSERVEAARGVIEMTWSELYGPFLISLEPGNDIAGDWGVSSCMIPARSGSLTLFGRKASGAAFPEPMAGQDCSTAALAFAENWYRPK